MQDHYTSSGNCDPGWENTISGDCDTPSVTTMDISYTYQVKGDSTVQVGCINCLDRDAPFSMNDTGGYFTSTDDPRGSVVFARWTQQF